MWRNKKKVPTFVLYYESKKGACCLTVDYNSSRDFGMNINDAIMLGNEYFS